MTPDEAWKMGLYIFTGAISVAALLGLLTGYLWGRWSERRFWIVERNKERI